ncbi:MAG: hypothetical protein GY883_16295 [Shimia sp.]|nr:hypothetical protein [Shimia sp.]
MKSLTAPIAAALALCASVTVADTQDRWTSFAVRGSYEKNTHPLVDTHSRHLAFDATYAASDAVNLSFGFAQASPEKSSGAFERLSRFSLGARYGLGHGGFVGGFVDVTHYHGGVGADWMTAYGLDAGYEANGLRTSVFAGFVNDGDLSTYAPTRIYGAKAGIDVMHGVDLGVYYLAEDDNKFHVQQYGVQVGFHIPRRDGRSPVHLGAYAGRLGHHGRTFDQVGVTVTYALRGQAPVGLNQFCEHSVLFNLYANSGFTEVPNPNPY